MPARDNLAGFLFLSTVMAMARATKARAGRAFACSDFTRKQSSFAVLRELALAVVLVGRGSGQDGGVNRKPSAAHRGVTVNRQASVREEAPCPPTSTPVVRAPSCAVRAPSSQRREPLAVVFGGARSEGNLSPSCSVGIGRPTARTRDWARVLAGLLHGGATPSTMRSTLTRFTRGSRMGGIARDSALRVTKDLT